MKRFVLLSIAVIWTLSVAGQNPFAEYGYTPRIATLSKGQFNEFHDQDTVVQIGSVLYNTRSKQIVAFVETDTVYSEATLQPDIVSRWISPDPLADKFAHESPYIFVGNNPISFYDPNGQFKIHIHSRITSNALKNSGLGKGWLGLVNHLLVQGATRRADIAGGFSDYHFDGRKDFKSIQSTWDGLNKQISAKIEDIGPINKKLGGSDFEDLGVRIHTVQDFYSHSNYVELYVEYYKSVNDGAFPTEVPTYEEGLKIEGFKKLMSRNTFDKNGKYQGLHTGEFNLSDNEFWDLNPFSDKHTGPNSHKQTNKDEANTPEGKLAEAVATKHTTSILEKLKQQ